MKTSGYCFREVYQAVELGERFRLYDAQVVIEQDIVQSYGNGLLVDVVHVDDQHVAVFGRHPDVPDQSTRNPLGCRCQKTSFAVRYPLATATISICLSAGYGHGELSKAVCPFRCQQGTGGNVPDGEVRGNGLVGKAVGDVDQQGDVLDRLFLGEVHHGNKNRIVAVHCKKGFLPIGRELEVEIVRNRVYCLPQVDRLAPLCPGRVGQAGRFIDIQPTEPAMVRGTEIKRFHVGVQERAALAKAGVDGPAQVDRPSPCGIA